VATAAALVAAAVAGHVRIVGSSESTAPARAGAARPSRGEEGGAGHRLVIVGETELLERQHVMSPGKCGKDGGVGDVVGGVGEARVEAAQKGEDELRVRHRMADVAKSGGLDLQSLAVRRRASSTRRHG
jgi:hypothetical protein